MAAKGVSDIRLLIRMGWYARLVLAPPGSAREVSGTDLNRWVNILKPLFLVGFLDLPSLQNSRINERFFSIASVGPVH
ncbi:unannotated protein [freshwater metagenome]|uniref:Unannotated protein n=1 Tax=freshwater metagenome TaxID=449393 RepID=A0A6J7JKR7_9ZZZZ